MKNGVQPGKSKRAASRVQEVEAGSGNVFADLDVPDADAALAKAELARRICLLLSERKLTQARAAAVLGIDQPKVSALVRGKLDGFSTDRLFRFLNALGQDVEIVVRPRRRNRAPASTRVVTI
jgi:predicted XRE-type DNA-binding protein